jgi:hypothetical protein
LTGIKVLGLVKVTFAAMNETTVGQESFSANEHVLDTRPLFALGQTPCDAIDNALAGLAPGQSLVLLTPFEPVPLYAKLQLQGFTRDSQKMDDGSWRIVFRK